MDQGLNESLLKVRKFCEDRAWDQYHRPKDLAIGLVTEASELLELFRFKNDHEIAEYLSDPGFREQVEDELADVFFFLLRFTQMNQVDLLSALENKLEKNALKYPLHKAKGSNKKYTDL